jgi:hypothetical protein
VGSFGHRRRGEEALLADLERVLYGINYAVFRRAYRVAYNPGGAAERYAAEALGPSAVIGGVVPATGPDILAKVERSIRYAGHEGSGPKPIALRTRRFKSLVLAALAELERAVAGAELLAQFLLPN